MKKNIIFLMITLLALSSCYKDNSAVNYKMINPLRIENGTNTKEYYAFTLDTLVISPIVYKEGVKDDDLDFYWEISGNLVPPTKIGDKMSLKTELNLPPDGLAYNILFRVTDKTTGIYVEEVYQVTIRSPFGSGLLVSDSHDGSQSDVSLIMARNFNGTVKKGTDTIMYNLFSRMNLRKVNGIVTSMSSNIHSGSRSLAIATMNSIERVDPNDFFFMDANSQMFCIDPGVYKIGGITFVDNQGVELLINDGQIYPRGFQGGNKLFGYQLVLPDLSEYNISRMTIGAYLKPIGFDELGGRAITTSATNDALVSLITQDKNSPGFKPSKLQGFTCLSFFTGLGDPMSMDYHMILENKITKRRYSYIIGATNGFDNKHGIGKQIIDLDPALCPDVQNAIAFDATENQRVIYYATKDKIYAVCYPTIIVTEEYNIPDGEEITGIMAWKNFYMDGFTQYTNPNPNVAPDKKILEARSVNRMLVITTYNPTTKEGFIRTVAITNIGSGRLEKDRALHNEFGGFGKISSIAIHKQK